MVCNNENLVNNTSKVIIVKGPMFAGKSSKLIEIYSTKCKNNTIICIKYHADARYCDTNFIATHPNMEGNSTTLKADYVCSKLDLNEDLINEIKHIKQNSENPVIVLIDEVQFFKNVGSFVNSIICVGIQVYCFGLNYDFKRELFPSMKELLDLESKPFVVELSSVCSDCNNPALYTRLNKIELRSQLTGSNDNELIGGAEKYSSTCLDCHIIPEN